jgi:hypothetical protein
MIKPDQAQLILFDAIEKGTTHKNYKRVCIKADEYNMFYTGNGIADKIREIYGVDIPVKLVFSIIPPILKSTKYPFNRVCRTKPAVRKIDFENDGTKEKQEEVEKALSKYYHGADIERFFENIVVTKNYTDPNAWIVTEFKDFDNLKEKAKPYPAVYSAKEAINYEYMGGELQYLLILQKENELKKWTMYIGEYTLIAFEKSKEYELQPNDFQFTINNKEHILQIKEPKSDFVPAIRAGYIRDVETEMETFVSVFDAILPYMYKILKLDFEIDSTLADIAFPKRKMFVDGCKHEGCRSGRLLNGEVCPTCKGLGVDITHKTSFDIQTFPMPPAGDEIMDLSKLSYTEYPLVAAVEMMVKIGESQKDRFFGMMFNSDAYEKAYNALGGNNKMVEATADNMNDAIYPFAQHLADIFVMAGRSVATFLDYPDAIVYFQYPKDFKFKSLGQLFAELQSARSANASPQTISAIETEINEQQYVNAPEVIKEIRTKNMFNPFYGLTEETVRAIVATKQTSEYNAVLWANIVPIFSELEMEWDGNTKPWLYDLETTRIKALVGAKVADYIAALPKTPEPQPINFGMNE